MFIGKIWVTLWGNIAKKCRHTEGKLESNKPIKSISKLICTQKCNKTHYIKLGLLVLFMSITTEWGHVYSLSLWAWTWRISLYWWKSMIINTGTCFKNLCVHTTDMCRKCLWTMFLSSLWGRKGETGNLCEPTICCCNVLYVYSMFTYQDTADIN